MARRSLQDVLDAAGDPVRMLRNSRIGAYVYPVVPMEFSNWRSEQQAWRETAVLYDQSHHMSEITLKGPDAMKLCSRATINSFAGFGPGKAKQMVPVSHDGFVIGDGILFCLEPDELLFVGRTPTVNWLEFQAKTGGYNVESIRDERSPSHSYGNAVTRRHCRYQVQGPKATAVLQALNGGPLPEIKFFHHGCINVMGRKVRALRHGMAGEPGLELWGPYEARDEIRAAIIEAGKDHGLVLVGARAYSSNTLESGWIPSPLPAVYTGDRMRAYREWLPDNGYEAMCSIGGSFVGKRIEEYYSTPFELGYGPFIKFDHDFIGREALETMAADPKPKRKKATFVWNAQDLGRVMTSLLELGEPFKFFDLPNCNYASSSFDAVKRGGKIAGLSMFGGYSYNERCGLSLGVVDADVRAGEELTLAWGEENGGTAKPTVERHRRCEVRVKVGPTPFSRDAREGYHAGWRTKAEALA